MGGSLGDSSKHQVDSTSTANPQQQKQQADGMARLASPPPREAPAGASMLGWFMPVPSQLATHTLQHPWRFIQARNRRPPLDHACTYPAILDAHRPWPPSGRLQSFRVAPLAPAEMYLHLSSSACLASGKLHRRRVPRQTRRPLTIDH